MEEHPRRDRLVRTREAARVERAKFLQMYPFRENPAAIDTLMVARQHAEGFVTWLERNLRWLGGINLRSREPHKSAAEHIREFRDLLHITVDGNLTPFQKVDARWDGIPWFGGEDRQIAKKIVATYYPDETLPIFSTSHLEHFVSYLGMRAARDDLARAKYDRPYGDMLTVGQKWELLSEVLLAEKGRDSVLRAEDTIWLMYCLYYGSACPPGFKVTEPR